MIPPASDPPAASAAEVLALVRILCQPLAPVHIQLDDATGRVLRESVAAPEDQPAFDRSAVDGFAVQLDDPSVRFLIVDEIRAGDWKPRDLQQGEAVRIATGGAIPGTGLEVVMLEETRIDGPILTIPRRTGDRNIRFKGEDARAGQTLVESGIILEPGALALLAGAGCSHPLVSRLPEVLHLATGNEIVPPGQQPERGHIRDTNSTLVRAFLGRRGIVPIQVRTGEDREAIATTLRAALAESPPDILLISGGASVGQHDFTRQLLVELGFTIHVSRTTSRPGKPLIVARKGQVIAFGLPGNPLAHFVCLNLFLRAALNAFAGLPAPARGDFQTARLTVDLPADGSPRETFWPARWSLADGTVALMPLRWASSGDLTSLASANALIRVPARTTFLEQGSQVQFIPANDTP